MNEYEVCAISSYSEEQTALIGEMVSRHAFSGLVFLLEGELGAGKTTLVRGFCRAEGCSNVRSPSFTLVNRYDCKGRTVVHSDFYRLGRVDPVELDIESYMDPDCVLFIEWADRGLPWDFDQLWRIRFDVSTDLDDVRVIKFSAEGDRAKRALVLLFSDLKREKML